MTPILFETFNVSAIYVAIQAVLSLCGSLHRDETCLLPTETAVPLATSAVPVATTTLAAPAMHAAPVLPVSYAATAPIVEYVSPAPAGSYVAPALVVDTTRQLQWCLLLHQRLSSIRRASSSGVLCCTSACVATATLAAPAMYAAHGPVVEYIPPVLLDMSRLLPQCTSRPLQSCTRHKRQWWSTSRPLQPCTRRKRLWWSTSRPALAVYAAQAPHCASTGILLEAFKKVPPCTWRSRPYCLYMVRESVQQSVRVLTRSL